RAVGSSQSSAWPNTVLNTIIAESIDYMATQIEKGAGKAPSPEKLKRVVADLLKKTVKQHKRVIFNGDGYSVAWHKEAEKRGLPHLRDSIDALPVIRGKKSMDLFARYKVLSREETESRAVIFIEKYAKQVQIEAETMVSMARTMIMPAALAHQKRVADAIEAAQGAGVDCEEQRAMLEDVVALVNGLRARIEALDHVTRHHGGSDDPLDHAKHIKQHVKPAMADLRQVADDLEAIVADELWPMPKYRDLLFIK
ncbi:MAG: glutamine synthetase type III, partial [Phycisphaerales bacterium]